VERQPAPPSKVEEIAEERHPLAADSTTPIDDTELDDGDDAPPPISGEAARSAFDALFSIGASAWGSAMAPLRREKKPDPVEESASDPETLDDDLFGDELVDVEFAEGDDSDVLAEAETTERPKRKRSRRRRGRGKKVSDETTESIEEEKDSTSEKSSADDSELEDETARPKRRRRRRSRRKPDAEENGAEPLDDAAASDNTEYDADDDDDDDDVSYAGSKKSGRGRPVHQNLPTWQEAVGMIVDANLESRAKSPSKPSSPRGRGRGRGGRGRRSS
jgi:hypothetical protein